MIHQVIAYPIHEIGQRPNQEDSLFPMPEESSSMSPLYILCDGMGGHAAGEVASQTVCTAMSDYVLSHLDKDGAFDEGLFAEALKYAYAALDKEDTHDEMKMGTTMVLVAFHRDGCFVAHIGDSRVYHIRPSDNRILYVSRDHSLVNELIELGEITPEEAKTSRQKNVITRAMQPGQECPAKADYVNLTDLKSGDYIYMCSDGMLEQMDDTELVRRLSSHISDVGKVNLLKKATCNNRDNHSAWLIRIVSSNTDSNISRKPVLRSFILAISILVLLGCAAFFLHLF